MHAIWPQIVCRPCLDSCESLQQQKFVFESRATFLYIVICQFAFEF